MEALLIGVMILLYTAQSLLCRKYAECYPGKPELASPVFTIVSGLIVAFVSVALRWFVLHVQLPTVLLGLANALVLFGYNICLIRASQTGPYSILMVFSIAGGILIPTAAATVFFRDRLSLPRLAAILVILLAVFLISRRPGERAGGRRGFLFLCAGLGICNGLYGTLLDVQQRVTGVEEKEMMVALTYFAAACLAAGFLTFRTSGKPGGAMRQTPRSLFWMLVCSVTVAAAIHVLALLISAVDVSVLYTFDNAGVFCLSVIASCVFFRERLTKGNLIGCILMCAALVCVSLF